MKNGIWVEIDNTQKIRDLSASPAKRRLLRRIDGVSGVVCEIEFRGFVQGNETS